MDFYKKNPGENEKIKCKISKQGQQEGRTPDDSFDCIPNKENFGDADEHAVKI